jgi:hypothetical protein
MFLVLNLSKLLLKLIKVFGHWLIKGEVLAKEDLA